ncbi:MAG: rRNA maturation RNase YbeY [Clostridia bacterium]|nr:rRNA maturation RNase YbeY [Clostridia bacterium]
MRKNGHNIFIKNDQDKETVDGALKSLICLAAAKTLEYESFEGKAEISVTLTDDEKIRELNRDFRDIDRATDVLSFPLFDDVAEGGHIPLGDIVISLERARVQSAEYGHSFEREVAFLCVHSMLHLLGYDHMNADEEKVMFSRQKEILSEIGLER